MVALNSFGFVVRLHALQRVEATICGANASLLLHAYVYAFLCVFVLYLCVLAFTPAAAASPPIEEVTAAGAEVKLVEVDAGAL